MQNKQYIDELFKEENKKSEIRKAQCEIVEMQKNKDNINKNQEKKIKDV